MPRVRLERWGSEKPIYNIGAVEQKTGVLKATLRAWERRYEFPQPARTAGGHRLYSESQVRQLQWVQARIDEGMQTREAVQALQCLLRGERISEDLLISAAVERREEGNASLGIFQERLTGALLDHDAGQADRLLGEVLALYPLEDLILGMIRPTLADIGCAWEEGSATVATEHFASHYLRHRLLAWMREAPRPHSVRPVALACAPGEWHEGSLLIVGALLSLRRWPVIYLGQSVPLPDLADFVQKATPSVVVLVAMTEEPARALVDWPSRFPEAAEAGHPVITYGGLIFTEQPEWRDKVPGMFLGATLQEGIEALDRLMRDITALRL